MAEAGEDTRQRLLEAALEVFAEQGFQQASTRDICKRSGANVAAVNYHFGSKAELYRMVLTEPLRCMFEATAPMDDPALPLVEALRCFYQVRVPATHSARQVDLIVRLITREQLDPSGEFPPALKTDGIAPHHQRLVNLLQRHLQLAVADAELLRLTFSLVAISMPYIHGRPMIEHFAPQLLEDAPATVEHLTRQALAMVDSERQRRSKAGA